MESQSIVSPQSRESKNPARPLSQLEIPTFIWTVEKQPIDWLIDRLNDWLTDRLIDWLTDWSINRFIDYLNDRLNAGLINWLMDCPTDWSADWLMECLSGEQMSFPTALLLFVYFVSTFPVFPVESEIFPDRCFFVPNRGRAERRWCIVPCSLSSIVWVYCLDFCSLVAKVGLLVQRDNCLKGFTSKSDRPGFGNEFVYDFCQVKGRSRTPDLGVRISRVICGLKWKFRARFSLTHNDLKVKFLRKTFSALAEDI